MMSRRRQYAHRRGSARHAGDVGCARVRPGRLRRRPGRGRGRARALFGRLGADPRGGTCVEVGCGPGRMTAALAERFDRVLALDVSPAMLAQARGAVTDERRRVPRGLGRPARRSGGRGRGRRSSAISSSSTCRRASAVSRTSRRVRARARAEGEAFVQLPVLDDGAPRPRVACAALGARAADGIPRPDAPARVSRLPPHARRARSGARGAGLRVRRRPTSGRTRPTASAGTCSSG